MKKIDSGIKLKKGQIVEGADGSKYELEGNEVLVEGYISDNTITDPKIMKKFVPERGSYGPDFTNSVLPTDEVEFIEWGTLNGRKAAMYWIFDEREVDNVPNGDLGELDWDFPDRVEFFD